MKYYVYEDNKGWMHTISEDEFKFSVCSENIVIARDNTNKDIIAICDTYEKAKRVEGALNDQCC